MVNSMDKSYAEQGTNCDEAFSFMDTHNLNGRCKCPRHMAFTVPVGLDRALVVLCDENPKSSQSTLTQNGSFLSLGLKLLSEGDFSKDATTQDSEPGDPL